jgi:hypothetical protein
MAFAGEADHLEDCAGPHAVHVAQRIREMLIAAGLPLVGDIEDAASLLHEDRRAGGVRKLLHHIERPAVRRRPHMQAS